MGGSNSLILSYHALCFINSLGFALHPLATAHIIINIYMQSIGLDDDVLIGKVLPIRDVLIFRGSGLLLGMVIHGKKVSMSN